MLQEFHVGANGSVKTDKLIDLYGNQRDVF